MRPAQSGSARWVLGCVNSSTEVTQPRAHICTLKSSLSLSLKSGKVDRAAKTVFGGYSSLPLFLPKDLLPNFFFRRLISTSEGRGGKKSPLRFVTRQREWETQNSESSNDKCQGLAEQREEGSSKKVGWSSGKPTEILEGTICK